MERKPLVLVIEDEKDIARFIELELNAEGYDTPNSVRSTRTF
jgi:DNA-binding response OmpR family regulator